MKFSEHPLAYKNSTYDTAAQQFVFTYEVDGEEMRLEVAHSTPSTLTSEVLERIGFNIGMCHLLDLAEMVFPKKIYIYKQLPPLALHYWQQTFENMVTEKCYVLGEPLTHKFVTWETGTELLSAEPLSIAGPRDHAALCLTGGKESLAILKTLEGKKPLMPFFLALEMNVHRRKVYEFVKDRHPTVGARTNRKELFAPLRTKYGGLHCGVDIAHLVFNTMLHADQCAYVLIGNEYSANIPNDIYEGTSVNHQLVKTIAFAESLNRYIHQFVTEDFTYYSPFFGLYEYRIAELLFKNEDYLDLWTSCNQATDTVNFCSNCAKCAFTYLLARTKKSEEYLGKFFSHNMLDDVALFKPLIDFTGKKSLDCVGDRTEVWVATEDLLQQGVRGELIGYYQEHIRPLIIDGLPDYIAQINSAQRVPAAFPADIQPIFYEQLGLTDPNCTA